MGLSSWVLDEFSWRVLYSGATSREGWLLAQKGYVRFSPMRLFVTRNAPNASMAVNARLVDFYSASGRLLCRDALGAAEVRRAYLNERFLRDRVAVQRKRGGQTASAPVFNPTSTLD